jgi:hypothetical protein
MVDFHLLNLTLQSLDLFLLCTTLLKEHLIFEISLVTLTRKRALIQPSLSRDLTLEIKVLTRISRRLARLLKLIGWRRCRCLRRVLTAASLSALTPSLHLLELVHLNVNTCLLN